MKGGGEREGETGSNAWQCSDWGRREEGEGREVCWNETETQLEGEIEEGRKKKEQKEGNEVRRKREKKFSFSFLLFGDDKKSLVS